MAKYAPPRADGLKPYVVLWSSWGVEHRTVVYAKTPADARYRTCGGMRHAYASSCRRATPGDMPDTTTYREGNA